MGSTLHILNHVRAGIAPADSVLGEARRRRDTVAGLALDFPGALRTYRSGSIAAGLANKPVEDADGGLVLDRRVYPELGPDGGGELPVDIVGKVQDHIRPGLRELYPKARVAVMKRGLLITVGQPLEEGQDPSVDLVVALTRKDGPGLWIPNM
ncbi:MAG: hypothetical protein M3Q30_20935, partial [Actinomycetota bacterium]|nr:hypothetical protein [Actinomycetota bacterium]